MTPAAKLKQAIDKTVADRRRVPVSILRARADDYDEMGGAARLVRAGETQFYGADRPTDSMLVDQGQNESARLLDAISRAGRRR